MSIRLSTMLRAAAFPIVRVPVWLDLLVMAVLVGAVVAWSPGETWRPR